MWIPASVDQLERAARSGRLVEKKRFEAKRAVGRNKDVAIRDEIERRVGELPL
jgi:hypothetical protein